MIEVIKFKSKALSIRIKSTYKTIMMINVGAVD